MLMRTYDIAPEENPTDNFADAGQTYYTGYLAAKKLEISAGIGNNMFAPDQAVTREEMFTLLYNALNVLDRLPQADSGRKLSDFNDASQNIFLGARCPDALCGKRNHLRLEREPRTGRDHNPCGNGAGTV